MQAERSAADVLRKCAREQRRGRRVVRARHEAEQHEQQHELLGLDRLLTRLLENGHTRMLRGVPGEKRRGLPSLKRASASAKSTSSRSSVLTTTEALTAGRLRGIRCFGTGLKLTGSH